MGIYELEERVLMDAAAAADAAALAEMSDAEDADADNSEDVDNDDNSDTNDSSDDNSQDSSDGDSGYSDDGDDGSIDDAIDDAITVYDSIDDIDVTESPNILLVSSAIKDADVLADAAGENTIVINYDSGMSLSALIEQIKDTLGEATVSSIGIVSHSNGSNSFNLTDSETVDADSVGTDVEQTEFWENLKSCLDENGRVDIFACNVAEGDEEQNLVDSLESLTSLDFAASDDLTGNESSDADWLLETDDVDLKDIYFDSNLLESYNDTLANTAPEIVGYSVDMENDDTIITGDAYDNGDYIVLTNAVNHQSGGIIFDREFTSGDSISIEFKYYVNGTADGFSFFLVDSDDGTTASEIELGASGGSLGYYGLTNAYIGIGFDEYGNFSSPNAQSEYDFVTGPGSNSNTIGVRGSEGPEGSETSGYDWIGSANYTIAGTKSVKLDIDLTDTNTISIYVDNTGTGNSYSKVLTVDLASEIAEGSLNAFPDNFYLGLAASTGGLNATHQIDLGETVITTSSESIDISYQENAVSTVIDLSATDGDDDTLTYSISGGNDSDLFSINSSTGELTFNDSPDYESPADSDQNNIYEVDVTVNDGNGGTDTVTVNVNVNNVEQEPINSAPTDISITSSEIAENSEAGTVVGALSTTDADAEDTHTYTITGGADAAKFDIVDGNLVTAESFDYENPSDANGDGTYNIEITTTDSAGVTYAESFAVNLTNVNDETPTDISISSSEVSENSEAGTVVGTLSTTDADSIDTHTYTISGGADAAKFNIVDGNLVTTESFDYENPSDANGDGTYNIEITTTDSGNLTYTEEVSVSLTDVNDTYTEQDPALLVLEGTDAIINTENTYNGGYIEFSVSDAGSSETVSFQKVDTADTTDGVISIVGSAVYLGNGETADLIGQIDGTYNGENGENLRVNFNVGFQNGNFESSSVGTISTTTGATVIDGWTVVNDRVTLGSSQHSSIANTIAGLATPEDTSYPDSNVSHGLYDYDSQVPISFRTSIVEDDASGGAGTSLQMRSSLTSYSGYAIIRGPYVYSNDTVTLESGDEVSFYWKAEGGSDAYDVFGYIVNVNDASDYQILINETGADSNASTSWTQENVTVDSEGDYMFVFISGSFDESGGKAMGAQLYIDDVEVTQAIQPPVVNSDILETIAQKVTYHNSSNLTSANSTIDKTITITTSSGDDTPVVDTSTIDFTVVEVNDAVTLSQPSTIHYTDTSGDDTFGTASGTLSATDPDSSTVFTYSITDGTDNGASFTKTGTYGTLELNKSTGDYTFTPNESAIEALTADTTENFEFNVEDGSGSSDAKTLTVDIQAVNDVPLFADEGGIDASIESGNYIVDDTPGEAGFGTAITSLTSGGLDDGYYTLDITDVFEDGITINDTTYTSIHIGTNGYITFGSGNRSYSAQGIAGYETSPMFAVLYTDLDLRDSKALPGNTNTGNSEGTGDLYYYKSGEDNVISVTYDDVSPYSSSAGNAEIGNAMQIRLYDLGAGEVGIEYRYEDITWTIGNGSSYATAGWTAGDGENYYELSSSGTAAITNVENYSNIGQPGVFYWVLGSSGLPSEVGNTINETETYVGAVVEATDAEGTTVSYSLSGNGADDSLFNIDSETGEVTFITAPDYEAPADSGADNVYNIQILATDEDGESNAEDVEIKVLDLPNIAPSDISISNSDIAEKSDAGTVVGALETTDLDEGDTHTYTITGGEDAAKFAVDGNNIITTEEFNFEAASDADGDGVYNIEITTTDAEGETYAETFAITLTDVNDIPTGVSFSSTEIAENSAVGTVVSTLATADEDNSWDTHTYTISGGEDAVKFAISGNNIITTEAFNFEAASDADGDGVYNIEITTTDAGGLTHTEEVAINLTDVNETPVADNIASITDGNNSVTIQLTSSDVDAGDTAAYSITTNPSHGRITLSGNQVVYSPDYNYSGADSFTYTVTDSGGLSHTATVDLTVNYNDEIGGIHTTIAQLQQSSEDTGRTESATQQFLSSPNSNNELDSSVSSSLQSSTTAKSVSHVSDMVNGEYSITNTSIGGSVNGEYSVSTDVMLDGNMVNGEYSASIGGREELDTNFSLTYNSNIHLNSIYDVDHIPTTDNIADFEYHKYDVFKTDIDKIIDEVINIV